MAWFSWWRRSPSSPTTTTEGSRFVRRSGRRYVNEIPYVLPKDDSEMSRLDFQHFMLRQAARGNYVAPVRNPHDVLDVGCGTGRWAREVATHFPQANVMGIDILEPKTDTLATTGMGAELRPDNYIYLKANVLEGLSFPDASFDFVHQRLLLGALPAAQWPNDIRELLRVTRPGGWIELVECGVLEGSGPGGQAIVQWNIEMCERRGIDNLIAPKLADIARNVGMRQVQVRKIALPVGPYGGRIGQMAAADYITLMSTTRNLIVPMGIASQEAYDAALEQMRQDIANRRCTWTFYFTYGTR